MDQPRSNLRPSRRLSWILPVSIAIATAAAYAALRVANRAEPQADAGPTVATSSAASAGDEPPNAGVSAAASASDSASLLASTSQNSLFRSWLAKGDLVRRWALVTVNLAEDVVPRKPLEFAGPQARFAVVRDGPRLMISPDAYARFDVIADLVDSVDVHAFATAYRALHPALEAAYRGLGYPGGSFDRVALRALRRIQNAPIPMHEPTVVESDGVFVFADPHLEQLGEIEKQLLRMGPRNERLIQAKARAVLEALELPTVASGGAVTHRATTP